MSNLSLPKHLFNLPNLHPSKIYTQTLSLWALHSQKLILPDYGLNTLHYTFLSVLFAALISCFPRGSLIRSSLYPLHILLLLQAYLGPPCPSTLPTATLYTQGVLLANLTFRMLDRIYLHTPETTFWRLRKDGVENPDDLPPTKKLLWGLELITITRGVGWNWRLPALPAHPAGTTRTSFLRAQLARWILMYTGLTLTTAAATYLLTLTPAKTDTWRGILTNPLFFRLFITLGWSVVVYAHFTLLDLPISILSVGLHIGPTRWHDPEAWPPNFGNLNVAYSLRRFWGQAWHAHLRRATAVPGVKLVNKIFFWDSKAKGVRLAKRYSLLLLTFTFSAGIHAAGTWAVTRSLRPQIPFSWGTAEFTYFLAQGVAVVVEDLVLYLLGVDDTHPPTHLRRYLGYLATAAWYAWSFSQLKIVSLAKDHGIVDGRGELWAGVEAVRRAAMVVPGNFVTGIVNVARAWGK